MPLFRRHEHKTPTDSAPDQTATASRNAARELELALREANRRIRQLEADVTRLAATTANARDQAAQRVLDDLAEAVAAPLAHMVGQQAILENGASELTAQDVAVVAGQIVRALERTGLQLHGRVGDAVSFDPDLHLVVGDRKTPAVGATVVIRSPGVSGMNEDSPTFLEAQPPARKGEGRFQVSFHIDDSERLLVSARDLKTGRWLYDRYPVVKLA